MDSDYKKLESLLLSGDKSNMEIALALSASQHIKEIEDLYKNMQEVHQFWLNVPLEGYPKELQQMIPYFKRNGINFFKNYSVRIIPENHAFLAEFIEHFYIWYTSFHSLPLGLGIFKNIREITVAGGPLTHIREEVWKLPELKKIELTIGKNFIWNKSLVFAEKLEEIKLTGTVYPPLPQCLPELEGLKTFSYRSLGNPKDEMPLPEYLWKIEQLNTMSLFGKTIPIPKGENFANLKHLKELELNYINWDHLPESISTLSHLDKLSIFNFIKLKSLPNWFANLTLTTLSLSNCKLNNAIELVSKMPNLKRLFVSANIQKKSTEEIWKAALPNVELTFIQ